MSSESRTPTLSTPKRTKNESIETLRGLAILVVVMGHVIGIDAAGAMKVDDGSFLRYLYVSTVYMCMPLFTAISGWVYAIRPTLPGQIGRSLRGKALRLLVPMVCVGTLYFLVQYITPGTNESGVLSEMWQIYVFPYTVFWYLPSLFLMFVFMILLDGRAVCNTPRAWGGWLVFACALAGAEPLFSTRVLNYFSIWGAMALVPYFMLGVGIRRFPELFTLKLKKVLLVGFCTCIVIQQIVWFSLGGPVTDHGLVPRLAMGLIVSAFLLTHKWHNRFLIWIGGYAYGIYLFHAFGTGGGRIVLKMFGIYSEAAIFVVALLLGVSLPIVLEYVLHRLPLPLLRTLFLGEKFRKEKKTA